MLLSWEGVSRADLIQLRIAEHYWLAPVGPNQKGEKAKNYWLLAWTNRKSCDLAGVLRNSGAVRCLRASSRYPAVVAMFVTDFRKEFYELLHNQVTPIPRS